MPPLYRWGRLHINRCSRWGYHVIIYIYIINVTIYEKLLGQNEFKATCSYMCLYENLFAGQAVFALCAQRYGFFPPGTTKKTIKAEYVLRHPCETSASQSPCLARLGLGWSLEHAGQWLCMATNWPKGVKDPGWGNCRCSFSNQPYLPQQQTVAQEEVSGHHQEGDQFGTCRSSGRPLNICTDKHVACFK